MKRITNFSKSIKLREKAHSLIPGGAHTYSKGDDQYPYLAPSFIVKGKGCHVWDVDGNEFIDYGMGLRSVILGYAYDEVDNAAIEQIRLGTNYTRPALVEMELAEKLKEIIPCAEMSKFGKNGSTITTAAVKLARAYTGRELVVCCKEHPFFSYDDWFIGTTPCDSGIPDAIKKLTLTFNYNKIETLQKLFEEHANQIACVILEPTNLEEPKDNFLQKVKDLCHKNGAIFILDEMITGFRWHLKGAQTYYNVIPDLATFGKGMANGYSLAALCGKKEIMEIGGIYSKHDRVFLISTTHGAENQALRAGLQTIEIIKREDALTKIWKNGQFLMDEFKKIIKSHNLDEFINIIGASGNMAVVCREQNKQVSMAFRTLYIQEMIANGVLIPWVAISYSHSSEDLNKTYEAFNETLKVYKKALNEGIEKYLVGNAIKPVFRKKN